ncbi:MAG: sulfotransferase [Bacteroidales bacterium]|nr:sulfotransferase [Bacteroidales bacterium]
MLNKGKKLIIPVINKLGKIREQKNFTKSPIIIGGCGRSGTTMLLSMLSAHPSVFAFPDELSIFNHWIKSDDGKLTPFRSDRMYRHLITHPIPSGKKRWCEKTPYNIRHIDEIIDYFNGNVKIIHIIRDGRDVCLSKHPDKPGEYWVEPERWVNDVRNGLSYKEHSNVYTVFYENLIYHYHKYMKDLLAFLGESFSDEMVNWTENTTVKKNNAWFGSVESLHSQSIGKWKKPENKSRVDYLMSVHGFKELLQELNYDIPGQY